jgi:polysaccharide biosynthesis protein PelC
VTKLAKIVKVDAVISGVVREYGDVRSGTASADVISISLQLVEGQTGRVVWSASTTQGGISMMDRLFGGGGRPLNDVTEKAVNDLIFKLFE